MVQRSSTHIVRSETLMEIGFGDLYSERAVRSGMTTAKADLIFASLPYGILPTLQKPVYDKIREVDAEFYAALEKAGFQLDFGEDEIRAVHEISAPRLGLLHRHRRVAARHRRQDQAGGRSGRGDHARRRRLDNGGEIPADVIVYATGYGSMNGFVEDLCGQAMADKVGKVWGFGSDTTKDPGPWEGEQRNMWKPTQQEALWFHGGNLHQSRHYSQFLALQLKARQVGIPTPVYGLQEVHHKA